MAQSIERMAQGKKVPQMGDLGGGNTGGFMVKVKVMRISDIY
jgi:hypothetical protein